MIEKHQYHSIVYISRDEFKGIIMVVSRNGLYEILRDGMKGINLNLE